jgi:hypothetical protein
MQKFEEFGKLSSIHGIEHILTSKSSNFKRIFWLFAISISICGFSCYVYSACRRLMINPETVMKATDRNSHDFPAPAVTVCPGLFAKSEMVNFRKSFVYMIENKEFSDSECKFLEANFHWCQPDSAEGQYIVPKLCKHNLSSNQSVVDLISKSAEEIADIFATCEDKNCESDYSRVFTDYGICYTWNSLSFSLVFDTETIHDDFKYYKRIKENTTEEMTSNWNPENGYELSNFDFPERAKKGQFYSAILKTNNKYKSNMCDSPSFRIYLHKPNEVVMPSHLIEYLNFGQV